MPSEALAPGDARIAATPRLDVRWKLLFTLAFVIAVIATPAGHWRVLGAFGLLLALVLGLSGANPRVLFLRWLGFLLLVVFIALAIAPGIAARTGEGLPAVVLTILAKNSLAFLMMLALGASTPWPELLRGLRRLRIPAVLVTTLQFMERYVHVLRDELRRMTTARRARSFGRRRGLPWGVLASLVGMLLLRSFERSERVHSAMLARGWDGTLRGLEGGP
jgi:cobalt/nickel transport system permease protein